MPSIYHANISVKQDLTCGLLAVTQYGILTSVRHVINPRFNLSTPLVSGLVYIAPGVGFFVGSVVGGRFSDRTVKRYMAKREGVRLPKDRLNSGLSGLFIVLPISMLLYGWSLDREFGGLALPIVAGFWVGVGLMGTFNALNTYTAEVSPAEKADVICTKYIVQYIFGAACTAAVVPLIDAIGVGWAFTLCKCQVCSEECIIPEHFADYCPSFSRCIRHSRRRIGAFCCQAWPKDVGLEKEFD